MSITITWISCLIAFLAGYLLRHVIGDRIYQIDIPINDPQWK